MSKSRKKRPSDALFEYACSLIADDKYDAVVAELEPLHELYPDELRISAVLGGAYYEAGRPSEAATCIESVVQRRPKDEFASLVLFHSLLDLRRKSDAIAEARRFLAAADDGDYSDYRDELAELEKSDTA